MQRIRVPMATALIGIGAAVPTYIEVPGSYQPIIPGKVDKDGILAGVLLSDPVLAGVTVLVDVPDEDASNGVLDNRKLLARYPEHPLVRSGVIK